jgi:hypothetical protein
MNTVKTFYGKRVTVDMADIITVLMEYKYTNDYVKHTMYRFEHLVEQIVRPRVRSSDISLQDFTLYVGAIASLLWTNRDDYYKNTPLSLSVKQHENGTFSSCVRYE